MRKESSGICWVTGNVVDEKLKVARNSAWGIENAMKLSMKINKRKQARYVLLHGVRKVLLQLPLMEKLNICQNTAALKNKKNLKIVFESLLEDQRPLSSQLTCLFRGYSVSTERLYWHRGSLAGPQQDGNKSSSTPKYVSMHNPRAQTCPKGQVLLFWWNILWCIRWLTGPVTDIDTYWNLPEMPCLRNGTTTCGAGASWQWSTALLSVVCRAKATIFVKIKWKGVCLAIGQNPLTIPLWN